MCSPLNYKVLPPPALPWLDPNERDYALGRKRGGSETYTPPLNAGHRSHRRSLTDVLWMGVIAACFFFAVYIIIN